MKKDSVYGDSTGARRRNRSLGAAMKSMKSLGRKWGRKEKEYLPINEELEPAETDPFRSSGPKIRRQMSVPDIKSPRTSIAFPAADEATVAGAPGCAKHEPRPASGGSRGRARPGIPALWMISDDVAPPVPPIPTNLATTNLPPSVREVFPDLAAKAADLSNAKDEVMEKLVAKLATEQVSAEAASEDGPVTSVTSAEHEAPSTTQTNDAGASEAATCGIETEAETSFTHVLPDPPQPSYLLPKKSAMPIPKPAPRDDNQSPSGDDNKPAAPATASVRIGLGAPPGRRQRERAASLGSPRAPLANLSGNDVSISRIPTPIRKYGPLLTVPSTGDVRSKLPNSTAKTSPTIISHAKQDLSATVPDYMNKGFPSHVTKILGQEAWLDTATNTWHVSDEGMMRLNSILAYVDQNANGTKRSVLRSDAFVENSQPDQENAPLHNNVTRRSSKGLDRPRKSKASMKTTAAANDEDRVEILDSPPK